MHKNIEGVFRNGKIELNETTAGIPDETPVVVTFVGTNEIDLQARGIDRKQAAQLRAAFSTFEDWNDPSMDEYDDYDRAKSKL